MRFKEWLLSDKPQSDLQAFSGRIYRKWFIIKSNLLTLTGLFIILTLILTAIFAPLIAPHHPNIQDLGNRLQAPSSVHLFGTDHLGRDILSRVIHGARLSLYIIFIVAVICSPLGLIIGVTAGYYGGIVDKVLMRVTDIFMAFPRLILALAFVSVMGPGMENAIFAIAITTWPPYARVSRAETLLIRNVEFIQAIKTHGASSLRILMSEIIPMCSTSVIIRTTIDMSGVLLTAAGLGFLGLGVKPPSAEWGSMIASGKEYMIDHWWIAGIPGIAIFIVSLGFNLLGDGLRDVFDPKHRS